jgi:uncharacterized protein YndB with AHSA1/START domain
MASVQPKPASATESAETTLDITRVLDASRERVFRAWTDATELSA